MSSASAGSNHQLASSAYQISSEELIRKTIMQRRNTSVCGDARRHSSLSAPSLGGSFNSTLTHRPNTGKDRARELCKQMAMEAGLNVGITCNACADSNFYGYRYKCSICTQYDLCADCFETRRTSEEHSYCHPVIFICNPLSASKNEFLSSIFSLGPGVVNDMFTDSIFERVQCRVCSVNPIRGIRIKCDDCVDYDLCWTCYKSNEVSMSHALNHAVVAHFLPSRKIFNPDRDIVRDDKSDNKTGCFGSVQKVQYQGRTCALKTMRVDGRREDKILFESYSNELHAYNELCSNHIIKYYGHAVKFFSDHTDLYLLMEYMEKGSIKDIIESCNSKDIAKERLDEDGNPETYSLRRRFEWVLSIAKALRRMHAKGFVHKDIKPDNILVNSRNSVKVGDMGVAIHDEGKGYFHDRSGPILYSAPELLLGVKFDNKVDIYSFGLVVYEIFTFKPITPAMRRGQSPDLISFPEPAKVFMPLIQKCVKYDPDERPSAAEIEEKLSAFNEDFWASLLVDRRIYMSLPVKEKDNIFLTLYESNAQVNLTF